MHDTSQMRAREGAGGSVPGLAWLDEIAEGASRDAGGVPTQLLGDYLLLLADAATYGRRPERAEIEAVAGLGRRAAESGVSAGRGVGLYLSAARLVWAELPAVIRERDSAAVRAAADAVLHVIDDAVAAFAQGHAEAGRDMVRHEEQLRRQFIEDLLRGDGHLGDLVQRAEPFSFDLTRAHQVALASPGRSLPDIESAATALERAVLTRFGDRDVLVATKHGQVVVIAPADPAGEPSTPDLRSPVKGLGKVVYTALDGLRPRRVWRVAVGRLHAGAYGIARSYEEARDGLSMSARMDLDSPIINVENLLVYRVLLRDQPAIVDLVHSVLSPLTEARGGAQPLVDTLDAYFATGGVATEAAARLGLSVRAVTYRLNRIGSLTGYDPTDPAHQFTVHAAVLGARLLGWPEQALPGRA